MLLKLLAVFLSGVLIGATGAIVVNASVPHNKPITQFNQPAADQRTIKVGIRLRMPEGLRFFGLDEVNGLLQQGARIVRLEPGGALLNKVGQDGENVRLVVAGGDLSVVLDDAPASQEPL